MTEPHAVRRLLGALGLAAQPPLHRSVKKMMRRYAAVTDQTLRAAAEAVSGHESLPTRRRGGNRPVSPRRSSPRRRPLKAETRVESR